MTDILTFIVGYFLSFAIALAEKVHDPIGWIALVAALGLGLSRRPAWTWWILALLLLVVNHGLRSYSFSWAVPPPRPGDAAALAVVCGVAWYVGYKLRSWLVQGSGQNP